MEKNATGGKSPKKDPHEDPRILFIGFDHLVGGILIFWLIYC